MEDFFQRWEGGFLHTKLGIFRSEIGGIISAYFALKFPENIYPKAIQKSSPNTKITVKLIHKIMFYICYNVLSSVCGKNSPNRNNFNERQAFLAMCYKCVIKSL